MERASPPSDGNADLGRADVPHAAAPGDAPPIPGGGRIAGMGIGKVTVGAVFVLLVVAWAAHLRVGSPMSQAVRDILLTGFVGGFTNTIAIRMLFERVWYLPGSGVLLAKREAIIGSLADTMEAHILNPDLLERWLRTVDVDHVRRRITGALNAVLDEVRDDLIRAIDTPERRQQIAEALSEHGGFWGNVADALGIVTYDDVATRLVEAVSGEVRRFQVTEDMVDEAFSQLGSLEDFLLRPDNPVVMRHYGRSESVAELIFEAMNVKRLVVDRLSAYEPAQVRDIISDNIREHMAWLEVFGVLLGLAFGLLAQLMDLVI